jgi:predicted ATP-dependent endonuclease of OLD family
MHIISLKAENIKKLRAVEIVPEGNVIKITGKNGAGKSSVLDSIVMAFEGGKKLPKRPIRDGETEAQVVVETEDFTITRTFTEKGSYLEVRNKEGAKMPSPQALLDKVLGQISFDPLEFFDDRRYDAKARKKLLLDMLGLDFSKTDDTIAGLYDKRTDVNREAARFKASAAQIIVPADTPDNQLDLADLQAELETANDENAAATVLEQNQKTMKANLAGCDSRVRYAQAEVTRLEEAIEEANKNLDKEQKGRDKLKKQIDEFEAPACIDTDSIVEQMSKIQEVNAAVVNKHNKAKSLAQAKDYEKQSDDITAKMAELEGQKTAALGKSKMPIPGLSIGADGLAYGGIPVEQISDSEKLRVGVAISMALNPTLKVLRIIDGSLLDKNSMKIIADMVKGEDYQVFVEVVDDTGKVGIYIEDGSVKKVNK